MKEKNVSFAWIYKLELMLPFTTQSGSQFSIRIYNLSRELVNSDNLLYDTYEKF